VADPAWILYDLITNTRYGLGRYIDQSQIDKWALYEISQYCNEYVPNGYGSYEHRFQCHLLLDGKEEAYKIIQQFLSIFRGFSYWMSGAIGFATDKPGSPVAQFTQSDIEEGMFSYTRTGLKTKQTIALVTWANPDDFYRQSVEAIDDPDGIAKYGVREIELSAFACTSRGQARRAGYAVLLTDRLEQETVTFKCRAYGAYTKPGDIIRIMDSKRADIRHGGLIVASTTTTIKKKGDSFLKLNNYDYSDANLNLVKTYLTTNTLDTDWSYNKKLTFRKRYSPKKWEVKNDTIFFIMIFI
jgi:predicted phage tail protein